MSCVRCGTDRECSPRCGEKCALKGKPSKRACEKCRLADDPTADYFINNHAHLEPAA